MNKTMNKVLTNSFTLGIKPEKKVPIDKWVFENVHLPTSDRADTCDLSLTPWLKKPLEMFCDPKVKLLVLNSCVGAGKSTFIEAGICYAGIHRPGEVLAVSQSMASAKKWIGSRLVPTIQACKPLKPFLRQGRYTFTNDKVDLSHMNIFLGAANKNTVQSVSIDYVLGDECWLYPDYLSELKRRTHDRYGAKTILVSQAGWVGDAYWQEVENCTKFEWCFKCRGCGKVQPINWEDIKYEVELDDDGNPLWSTLKTWYECPVCGEVYENTEFDRRSISNSGEYVAEENKKAVPGHYCFHVPAMGVWKTDWNVLAREWIEANISYKKWGNTTQLETFTQQRLSQFWTPSHLYAEKQVLFGSYSKKDAKSLLTDDDEVLMAVDVQGDCFYYIIRAWASDGTSKLLACGNCSSFEDILFLWKEWGVGDMCCAFDIGYADRKAEVLEFCARHNQIGLNGTKSESYQVHDPRNPAQKIKSYVGPREIHSTASGEAWSFNYSSQSAKSLLSTIMQGGKRFQVPHDIGQNYEKAMQSEAFVPTEDGKGKWETIDAANNHLWDCECMCVILAMKRMRLPSTLN